MIQDNPGWVARSILVVEYRKWRIINIEWQASGQAGPGAVTREPRGSTRKSGWIRMESGRRHARWIWSRIIIQGRPRDSILTGYAEQRRTKKESARDSCEFSGRGKKQGCNKKERAQEETGFFQLGQVGASNLRTAQLPSENNLHAV